MARVFLGAAVTLQICEGAETAENPWRSIAGSTESYMPSWIWYCSGIDHNPPASNRSPDADWSAHRSWTSSHYLIKGYFHGKLFSLFVTRHG